jgi:hypothetical protein
VNADAAGLKRPEKLQGLSPWSGRRLPVGSGQAANRGEVTTGQSRSRRAVSGNLEERVRAIVDAMDPRGAWLEEGSIGKANRLVTVFAAKDMVVTLGGKTMPIKENDTLEVFVGADAPKERIIVSRTFAENIGALSSYLAVAASQPR